MPTDDKRAVDEILRKRREAPGPVGVRHSLYRYRDVGAWPPDALALVPVGVVAEVEGVVRDAVRQLVDAGSPFVDRTDGLDLRVRPGLEAMKALHGQKISLGEWVSHLVRISSVEHVQAHLSTLFGAKGLTALISPVRYFEGPTPADFGVDHSGEPMGDEARAEEAEEDTPLIIDDPARVVASLGRLFAARHRAAHEGLPPAVSPETIGEWVDDASLFCDAVEHLLEATLRPLEPSNTYMMNLKASVDLDQTEAELDAAMDTLCTALRAIPETPPMTLRMGPEPISSEAFAAKALAAQVAFEHYKEAETEFQMYFWPDGTGWRAWALSAQLDVVQERLRRVQASTQTANDFFGHDDDAVS